MISFFNFCANQKISPNFFIIWSMSSFYYSLASSSWCSLKFSHFHVNHWILLHPRIFPICYSFGFSLCQCFSESWMTLLHKDFQQANTISDFKLSITSSMSIENSKRFTTFLPSRTLLRGGQMREIYRESTVLFNLLFIFWGNVSKMFFKYHLDSNISCVI